MRVGKAAFLTCLCALALLVCTAPSTAHAKGVVRVNRQDLLTEGSSVVCGDGSAVYDATAQTLTLTNATIDKSVDGSFGGSAPIFVSNGDLTIVLVGQNRIISDYFGIYSEGYAITIQGDGTLDIDATNDCVRAGSVVLNGVEMKLTPHLKGQGIYATTDLKGLGTIVIKNGTNVTIQCGGEGRAIGSMKSISITDSVLNVTGQFPQTNAIYASGDLEITASTVKATSMADNAYPAIWGGTVSIDKGSDVTSVSNKGNPIYAQSGLSIAASTVSAASSLSTAIAAAKLSITNGSTVNAVANGSGANAIYASEKLEITASTVEARATEKNGNPTIWGKDIIIGENSTVRADSGGGPSNTIYAPGSLEITASTVEATGMTSNNTSNIWGKSVSIADQSNVIARSNGGNALNGNTQLSISDSTVSAVSSAGRGIWSNGAVSIQGRSDVTAHGKTGGIPAANGVVLTPAAGAMLEVKAGPGEADARHFDASPYSGSVTFDSGSDLKNLAYVRIKEHTHTFAWVVDVEPTETAPGSKHEACTDCGFAKAAVTIPMITPTPAPTQASTPAPTQAPPQTGDSTPIALLFAIFLLSAVGLAVSQFKRKAP